MLRAFRCLSARCGQVARFHSSGSASIEQRPSKPLTLALGVIIDQPIETKDMCILATDEGVSECALSSGAWLAATQPPGAYSTARTVNANSIFELSFHIDRLATSSRLMMEEEERTDPSLPHNRHSQLTNAAALRHRVLASIRSAVTAYREAHNDSEAELKVTVLITWDNQNFHVSTHVSALGARPSPPVKVQVGGAPRENAEAKDSEWVRARRVYEDQKPDDVNEVLLVGPDGGVYEGLSSNFFALVDGVVQTAGEGVLAGSVREAVLRVAERLGVPIELSPPALGDVEKWEGAFISSTSRLLLPIDEIQLPRKGNDPPRTITLPRSALARKLEAAVIKEVEACSEPLFE